MGGGLCLFIQLPSEPTCLDCGMSKQQRCFLRRSPGGCPVVWETLDKQQLGSMATEASFKEGGG